MAKSKSVYVCNECGAQFPKWMGRCGECGQWDTVVEELRVKGDGAGRAAFTGVHPRKITEIEENLRERALSTGVAEFDRVLGGGMLRGASVLVGGDPGIGKSTLLLQAVSNMARQGNVALYVSAEESPAQVKERAMRIGDLADDLYLVSETNVDVVKKHIAALVPRVIVIDSIQMLFRPEIPSAPGSVSQIRECAAEVIFSAKNSGAGLFLIGHITKEGSIAGPKVLEHIVDTVLYLEGDRHHFYRLLHAYKNRFGPASEIGVFEMTGTGMVEVPDAAGLFLSHDCARTPGSAATGVIQGTRTLYVEIQALASRAVIGVPKRKTTGFDQNRSAMLVAVLEKRAGLELMMSDCFVNAVGGVYVDEPAADLAAATAIASSFLDRPAPSKTLFIGEVGLGGEIRPVTRIEERLKDAVRFGFERAVLPAGNEKNLKTKPLDILPVENIAEIVELLEP